MAAASAIAAIFILLDGAVFAANMIPFTFEVALMTTCAEGCVSL